MTDIEVLWSPSKPLMVDGVWNSAEDWLGHRFYVGGAVAYSISSGNSTEIAVGKVVSIKVTHHERSRTGGKDKNGDDIYRAAWDAVDVEVFTMRSSGRSSPRTKSAVVKARNVTWLPYDFLREFE
jgi:hypothetical protein